MTRCIRFLSRIGQEISTAIRRRSRMSPDVLRPSTSMAPLCHAAGREMELALPAQYGPAVEPWADRGGGARRGGCGNRRSLGRRSSRARAGRLRRIRRALCRAVRDACLSDRCLPTGSPDGEMVRIDTRVGGERWILGDRGHRERGGLAQATISRHMPAKHPLQAPRKIFVFPAL
jgi:hypothetical protein